MIKFVDLNNGHLFNAENPYIFWFDNEQSVDIIYSKSICVLSDKNELTVSLPDNPVFKLIDNDKLNVTPIQDDTSFNMNYLDINELYIKPENNLCLKILKGQETSPGSGQYLYIIYFTASSEDASEFIENFVISSQDESLICSLGADFYNENESLSINLSNFGVEIPESVQKAIYTSNIQEDNRDNILLNRKFKELISNYWDIIANKGSYKSLLDSLKWFEYSDIVRLREIWKHNTNGKIIYDDRELCSLLEDKYKDSLYGFCKTTYFALYATLEQIVNDKYDSEHNPVLEHKVMHWGYEDLALKMSLLGQFYERFFMPIHTSLIHSTIEDIVFTNSIKHINGGTIERIDHIDNFEYVSDNIKDHYILGNVETQVNNQTILRQNWNGESEYGSVIRIGVDEINKQFKLPITDDDLKTFNTQYYKGPGVIIPIKLIIPNVPVDDFIKRTTITFKPNYSDEWYTQTLYDIYKPNDPNDPNNIILSFNLLCTESREYIYKFQFITASSKIYTKDIKFDVFDIDNIGIDIYKIVPKKSISQEDINKGNDFNFIFKIQPKQDKDVNTYIQYIPINEENVRLNHVLVIKGDHTTNTELINNYFIYTRKSSEVLGYTGVPYTYTIGICKQFDYKPNIDVTGLNIIRDDFVFFPDFHKKQLLNGNKLEDYTIHQNELTYAIPHIKFGKYIEEYEWEFENASTLETIKLPASSQEPLIANNKNELLPKGYYNVTFKFKLDKQLHEIKLNSVFMIS